MSPLHGDGDYGDYLNRFDNGGSRRFLPRWVAAWRYRSPLVFEVENSAV
jgi:hypothetical protein